MPERPNNVSINHFIVELKIKTDNYYTKNINQWYFLMPLKPMSRKVRFVVVNDKLQDLVKGHPKPAKADDVVQ